MKKWIDWSDWKPGQVQAQHPLSKPLKKTGKGKDIVADQVNDLFKTISSENNPGQQPTDEQLFGHLAVSEEEANKTVKDWENRINNWFSKAHTPVEKQNKSSDIGRGPIHKEVLTEEEERIRAIPVDPSLLSDA